jgi:glucosyl-3-phosphoglycerate synthase
MSRQILGTVLQRWGIAAGSAGLTQFVQVAGEWLPDTNEVLVAGRPPMRDVLVR